MLRSYLKYIGDTPTSPPRTPKCLRVTKGPNSSGPQALSSFELFGKERESGRAERLRQRTRFCLLCPFVWPLTNRTTGLGLWGSAPPPSPGSIPQKARAVRQLSPRATALAFSESAGEVKRAERQGSCPVTGARRWGRGLGGEGGWRRTSQRSRSAWLGQAPRQREPGRQGRRGRPPSRGLNFGFH